MMDVQKAGLLAALRAEPWVCCSVAEKAARRDVHWADCWAETWAGYSAAVSAGRTDASWAAHWAGLRAETSAY